MSRKEACKAFFKKILFWGKLKNLSFLWILRFKDL